jgi:hypothetical protein
MGFSSWYLLVDLHLWYVLLRLLMCFMIFSVSWDIIEISCILWEIGVIIYAGCSIWLLNHSIISWRTALSAFAQDYTALVPVSVRSNSKNSELHDQYMARPCARDTKDCKYWHIVKIRVICTYRRGSQGVCVCVCIYIYIYIYGLQMCKQVKVPSWCPLATFQRNC